jgi:hypothetical protein
MGKGLTAGEANSLAEIGRKERLRSIADGLIFLLFSFLFFFFFFCFSGFGSKQWRCIYYIIRSIGSGNYIIIGAACIIGDRYKCQKTTSTK